MLPTGTLTMVFTDMEGSTQLLQQKPEDFPALLERHHQIIRETFSAHGGIEVDNSGDGFFFVFTSPQDAVQATALAQCKLNAHPWDSDRIVRVRMGIHTGHAQLNEQTYIGLDVHKAARIMAAAYGGQVLISQTVASQIEGSQFEGISVFALGEFVLKDMPQPEVLYQLLLEGASSPLPAVKSQESRKTNLPSRATPLVGREHEIDEIIAQIRQHDIRLLTLVGPGGIGKSSLAIEAGRALVHEFHDGVYVVFLAPVMDVQFVPSAIAQVLGFFLHTGIPVTDQLRDFIADKHMLLILDNFEHLLPASQMIAEMLEGCGNLRIFITSRIVLRSQWEWEHHVPPLPLAKAIGKTQENISLPPSVDLFIQRAHAIDPHFSPGEKDLSTIAEICDKLDGLPLAIELAAARIKVLSPKTILSRLCKRLDLLRGGRSDLPERHQTLRHAVGWSYELLKKREQVLFRRFGVFAGGFTLETAEALHAQLKGVGSDGLEEIISLRDQSLIRIADAKAPEPRYMMLETIREYALERLEEEGELSQALRWHAEWFLAQAQEASLHFNASDSKVWLDAVEADLDNYRAALKWAAEVGDAKIGLGLCNALWRFWIVRAFLQEGVSHLNTQLDNPVSREHVYERAKALNALGTLLHELSDYRGAHSVLVDAVDLLRTSDDETALANALNNLSWVSCQLGMLEDGEIYANEAYVMHERLGNTRGMGVSMNNLGYACFIRSDYEKMREYYKKHYALMEAIGDVRSMAYSLLCQTWGEQDSGRIAQTQTNIDRAIVMIEAVDDRQLIGWARTLQAVLFFHTRKFDSAKQFLLGTVEQATLLHNKLVVSLELVMLGASELKLGNLQQAKTYLTEALGYSTIRGSRLLEGMASRYLAECNIKEGSTANALKYVTQSYHARRIIQNVIGLADCAELLATVYLMQGRHAETVQLLAAASAIREERQVPIQESQVLEVIECHDEVRRKMSEADFERFWTIGLESGLEQTLAKFLPE